MPPPRRHRRPPSPRVQRIRTALRALAWLAVAAGVEPCRAADVDLLSAGIRLRVGEKKVLGQQQPVSFHAFDVTTMVQLPWWMPLSADWRVEPRVMLSAGMLRGGDETALLVSAVPVVAFDWRDGRFTVDLGGGLALLSRHRYAEQDYGGPLQFALTFGITVPVYRRITLGYRFMHYSDAGAYGHGSIGADFHMHEMGYRF